MTFPPLSTGEAGTGTVSTTLDCAYKVINDRNSSKNIECLYNCLSWLAITGCILRKMDYIFQHGRIRDLQHNQERASCFPWMRASNVMSLVSVWAAFTDCINSCISSGRWTNSLATFIYAVVNSRTDYCNTVLAGAPRTVTDKLQRVLNAAAHFVTGTRKFDRGLGQILHDQLHWLDVPNRVLFKLAVTVHQCPNGRAPPYLSAHCIPVSSADTRRHLRSANRHLLAIPHFQLNT